MTHVFDVLATASARIVPLIADTAHCGRGVVASGGVANSIDLAKTLCGNPATAYVAQVSGDSMMNAGIVDGEYVIVDPAVDAVPGDIVLVSLDGELLCKRLGSDGRLHSDNPKYAPIEITAFNELVILGCVVSGFNLFKRRITS